MPAAVYVCIWLTDGKRHADHMAGLAVLALELKANLSPYLGRKEHKPMTELHLQSAH